MARAFFEGKGGSEKYGNGTARHEICNAAISCGGDAAMTAAEAIRVLTSGNSSAIMAAAAEIAGIIEAQEERIAIMGEVLTEMEFNATGEMVSGRLQRRKDAGAEGEEGPRLE